MNGKQSIYGINKNNIDNDFCDNLTCEKCGYNGAWEKFEGTNNH
jgi:hypothetical protein